MSKLKLLFLLLFSLLFCDDGQGYVFELNFESDNYLDMESVVEYSQGAYDYYQLFSARVLSEFGKLDPSTGEVKMVQTFENVISSSRRNDEMRPDHDAQKLTGTTYTITIDSLGYILSTVGNSELAEEVIEESDEINWLFGVNTSRQNIKYFMGGDEPRNVGDVWVVSDSTFDVENTFGFAKFKGSEFNNTTYTFKKIKEKRGDKIAVVEIKTLYEVNGVGSSWEEVVDFRQSGEFKCKLTFNITKGFIVSNRVEGVLRLKGKNLNNDKSWNVGINVALKQKGKLK